MGHEDLRDVGCNLQQSPLHPEVFATSPRRAHRHQRPWSVHLELDVIGQSYYPFWHGTLQQLQDNLVDLASRYDKDLIVVETAYPWTLDNGDDLENILDSVDELPDATIWPPTPEGQLAYFTALRGVFGQVPNGRGLGFMSWEPEWVPGVGWTPGKGNPNDNLTLFDFDGSALPALDAFTPGRIERRVKG